MPATPSTSSHHLLPPPQNQPATPPAYSPSPTEEFPPPYARFDFPAAPKPAHIRWTDVSRGIFHHRSPGAITPHTWPSPRGEKARMTRTRRNLLLGVLVFLFFLIIILGSVLGARHNRSTPVPLTPDQHEPGTLPLGALALRPFRFADRLSTCVSTPRQWSCTLPPDTTFPTTNATNDGTRVPLFNFNIKRSSKTPFSTVPDAPTDYPLLLTADNVTTPGAKTDFYISLTTSTSPTASTGSGTLAPASLVLPNVFENQPLRLFNPGAQDEHYAAHIYFQKSVQFPNNTFASNTVPASNTVLDTGGVAASDAGYRVVWNWTRFRVAVYTRREAVETEVYIDRAGTGEEKSVMAYYLGENGEADKVLWVNEKRGVGTEKRGCFCRWGSED